MPPSFVIVTVMSLSSVTNKTRLERLAGLHTGGAAFPQHFVTQTLYTPTSSNDYDNQANLLK